MSTAVKFWMSFLLAMLTAYGGYSFWRLYTRAKESPGGVAANNATHPTTTVSDADLVDSQGKPFSLESLKGDVWLASFFFTACPGPCAQMNRSIAGMQREFPNKDLKFVSITCDPANDTPKVLAQYAKTFQAEPKRWIFLTGPFETVRRLGSDVFKVAVGHQMHSERVMLVDREMKVRGMYLLNRPDQVISLRRKLKSLLDNTAPAAADDTVETPAFTPPAPDPSEQEPEPDAANEDEKPAEVKEAAPATEAPKSDTPQNDAPPKESPAGDAPPADTLSPTGAASEQQP